MIRQFIAIAVLVYLAFLSEFVLFNTFGPWGKPELLMLAVVFCNLYWGIRHSIWAAFLAGLLKDSFSIETFGTYLLVYIAAAYLTTFIRNNLYQPGSRFSRMVVTFFVLIGIFVLEVLLHIASFEIRIDEAVAYILVPQLITTMFVGTYVFYWLRDLVSQFKLD
jgi:rod shape-determining protein MreD